MIQIAVAGLADMSPAIVGSATLAIELSSTDIVIASMTVSIAHRRCGSGNPSSAGPALASFSTSFSECNDIGLSALTKIRQRWDPSLRQLGGHVEDKEAAGV